MNNSNLIGQRIKDAREELGISQEDLAIALGLAPQSIQQWESGKTSPRPKRITKLAELLCKNPIWLQFGDDTNPENPLLSAEFKTKFYSAYARAIQNCNRLGWVEFKREDVSIAVLADIFYSNLLEECGIYPPADFGKRD